MIRKIDVNSEEFINELKSLRKSIQMVFCKTQSCI